ncbi:hypothetical protein KFL_000480320 [Klebsormidium nitens]|uniref:Uncharacterized protein n=1 Tax=Klebsormidium nitens TaxID=105231 RepID=A0A1Y1HT60_KLENI|nr:hypothetical protein KFL_000480320 [Klebsormidium nitens]|eukprot:GAQ80191.1 hypothetical protein KFL_000480320 [Klebsormidium nitens]
MQLRWSVQLVACCLLCLCTIGTVIRRVVRLSKEFDQGQWKGYLPGLQEGWLLNRQIDLSDAQWRNFRSSAQILIAAALGTTLLGSLFRNTPRARTLYWLLVGMGFNFQLHGAYSLFVLVIATANFLLVKVLAGRRLCPVVFWTASCAMLVYIRLADGFSFSSFGASWEWLDYHKGSLRWHIGFNLVMLRILSFGLDYHWKKLGFAPQNQKAKLEQTKSNARSLDKPEALNPAWGSYSFATYLCYLLYPPLYIAGPTITFDSFASQLSTPQQRPSGRAVSLYALRLAGCWGLMELLLHFTYFNALAVSGVWQRFDLPAADVCCIGFGVLNFMWLKFLIIWRFFRLWALMDGIDPPENMLRCVNNNYDIEGFWKSWHASYNRWLVRYLYIPLGGAKWRFLNIWVIFTFVALWHDLEWKLLSWAWLTCLLGLPELVVKSIVRSPRLAGFRKIWLYSELAAAAGALNITGLMAANLVGFVIGPQGLRAFFFKLLSLSNVALMLYILLSFYAATKVMFAIREAEEREKQCRKVGTECRSTTDVLQDVYLERRLREENVKRIWHAAD